MMKTRGRISPLGHVSRERAGNEPPERGVHDISVVLHPLTGKLAKAEPIDSTQLDDELISGYVQKGDFVQLVHAVWKRRSLEG